MTPYIQYSNSGNGALKRVEYIAYRVLENNDDGSWRFVEGADGYDYATYRNASKIAKSLNDYYGKFGKTKYKYSAKQVKVIVEVTS